MRGGIIILEGQNITLKGLEYHQLPILKEWMNDFEIAIKLLRIEPSITYFTEKWYNSFQDDRTKLIFSINEPSIFTKSISTRIASIFKASFLVSKI